MKRRVLLGRLGTVAAAGALAGCLDEAADGGGPDPGAGESDGGNGDEGDGNESDDTAPDGSNDTDDGNDENASTDDGADDRARLETYEVEQFAATSERPGWADEGDPSGGHLEVFDDAEAVREDLPFDDVDDEGRRDDLETFLEETDFETSLLLYVASAAPDASYDEIEVRELAVDDGRLAGTAAAVGGDGDLAAQVLTFPSALVRVAFEGGRPGTVELTVVDGWEEEHALEESV